MKKLIGVLVILVLTLVPESCLRQPPSVDDVESFMKKNWNDIVIVNGFLLELENSWAILSDDDGLIFIDFVDQRIEDDSVIEAIQSLWKKGCTRISKDNDGVENENAIKYTIWTRTIGSVACGFVYAIDHTQPPKVQFQTELIPLSIEGWYYYIDNYEEWRRLQHQNND